MRPSPIIPSCVVAFFFITEIGIGSDQFVVWFTGVRLFSLTREAALFFKVRRPPSAFAHSRNPPMNAFALSLARQPRGSFFSFVTLPPPRTTSPAPRAPNHDGSSKCFNNFDVVIILLIVRTCGPSTANQGSTKLFSLAARHCAGKPCGAMGYSPPLHKPCPNERRLAVPAKTVPLSGWINVFTLK